MHLSPSPHIVTTYPPPNTHTPNHDMRSPQKYTPPPAPSAPPPAYLVPGSPLDVPCNDQVLPATQLRPQHIKLGAHTHQGAHCIQPRLTADAVAVDQGSTSCEGQHTCEGCGFATPGSVFQICLSCSSLTALYNSHCMWEPAARAYCSSPTCVLHYSSGECMCECFLTPTTPAPPSAPTHTPCPAPHSPPYKH
jgi:hypothetical protein